MADPLDPPPATPPPPRPESVPPPVYTAPPVATSTSGSTGLPSNIAAALACFPLIGGIIFYLLEKRDSFVRFYAMQSIIFGGAWIIFSIAWNIIHAVLVPIPVVGWFFAFLLWVIWAVVNIGAIFVWIIAMIKAFSGVRWDIPYIGPLARKQVGESV